MNMPAVTNVLRCATILLCCLFSAARAETPSTADWSGFAPIYVPGDVTKGLVELPVTPEVFDAAKPDLSDLRIFDSGGVETGYVLRLGSGELPSQDTDAPDPRRRMLLPPAIFYAGGPAERPTTEIELDLGFRNLLAEWLLLSFADANFSRRISVYGRNSEMQIVSTPREDAAPLQKTVEMPWELIANTEIRRFTARGKVEESLTVKLDSARFRYLKIEIANADDPPLEFTGARVMRREQFAAFQPKPDRSYTLYFGNPNARPPVYDIAKYANRLRAEGVVTASLGSLQFNTVKRPPKPSPWLEQNRWVLWVVLAVGMIILGTIVERLIKSIGKPSDSGSPQT
jgi:hypothetical protein